MRWRNCKGLLFFFLWQNSCQVVSLLKYFERLEWDTLGISVPQSKLGFKSRAVLSKLKIYYHASETLLFKNCVSSNIWTIFFFVPGRNIRNVNRWNQSAKIFCLRISGNGSHWWEGKSAWREKAIILRGMQKHNTCTSR